MKAHRILKTPMAGPDDLESVEQELKRQKVEPDRIKGVMCMTEGDGLARGFASLAFSAFFHEKLGWDIAEVPKRIPLIMIGGCSGLVVPYAALFVEDPDLDGEADEPGLAIGIATTADIAIEDFGTTKMVDTVAAAVESAMKDAAIEPQDVHNVQIKTNWPLPPELQAAQDAGKKVKILDGWTAGMRGRGAGALGVATALGEIDRSKLKDEDIASNWAYTSEIGCASAGSERTNVAVIVMGNSKSSRSPYRIGHAVLQDGVDAKGVYEALASAGIKRDGPLAMGDDNPVDHVFVKSAVELAGECRGRRHVLQSDYLAPYAWLIAKSVVHATVTSIVGDPMMQLNGGGEHQGPPGGGFVAIVARK